MAFQFISLISALNVHDSLQNVLQWVGHLGPWEAIAFIGIYCLATVLLIPGSILTLGSGVLFGVGWGFMYVFIGASVGATVAFLIGRYTLRGWIAQQLTANSQFEAIDQAIAREGLKIVLLTRLSPIIPFNLLNYALGITQVSLRDYILGFLGMIPGTLMYVYIGSVVGSLANLTQARERTPLEWALYGVGLVATVTVTVIVTRIAREALDQHIATGNPSHDTPGDR